MAPTSTTRSASRGAPGERTGVAPISLEAIEQVQVNVAPFDVRQGNFVGAGVNTVTRSGTNKLQRLGSTTNGATRILSGRKRRACPTIPGTFNFRDTGAWVSGPVIKNRIFAFGNYEDEMEDRPLTTFRSNRGGRGRRRQYHASAGVGSHGAELDGVAASSVTTRGRSTTYLMKRRRSGS